MTFDMIFDMTIDMIFDMIFDMTLDKTFDIFNLRSYAQILYLLIDKSKKSTSTKQLLNRFKIFRATNYFHFIVIEIMFILSSGYEYKFAEFFSAAWLKRKFHRTLQIERVQHSLLMEIQ